MCASDARGAAGARRLVAMLGSTNGGMASCGPDAAAGEEGAAAAEEGAEGRGGRGWAVQPIRKSAREGGARAAASRPHDASSCSLVASSQATQRE